jgi:hypothetical protein
MTDTNTDFPLEFPQASPDQKLPVAADPLSPASRTDSPLEVGGVAPPAPLPVAPAMLKLSEGPAGMSSPSKPTLCALQKALGGGVKSEASIVVHKDEDGGKAAPTRMDVDDEVITVDDSSDEGPPSVPRGELSPPSSGATADEGEGLVPKQEDTEQYGRGKRTIKSCTIMINGDVVKLDNNYRIVGGRYEYGSEQATIIDRTPRQPIARPANTGQKHHRTESQVGSQSSITAGVLCV